MSALAKFLSTQKFRVSGSDRAKSEMTEQLTLYGITMFIGVDGARAELLQADLVVYTDAIPPTHAELQTARRTSKKIFSRAQLLERVCRSFQKTLAVAGSHGKTTCTSICAHVLKAVDVPFTAHIGGEDSVFGNFYTSGTEYFLTEACEYKKNLLQVPADNAVLLNIDRDHMECYKDEAELKATFLAYCKGAKTAFVCADDSACVGLGDFPSFGIVSTLADYRAVDLRASEQRYSFTVEEYGKPLCRIRLNAIGKCNVYNGLAAFALMRSLGFDEREIKLGIENFQSVKRRFERIGFYRGASFVCDYAHHPREILSTIRTAKGVCKGELYVVFQPHTYSRTKTLLPEFVSSLCGIKNLMVYKTFSAREKYDQEGSGERLSQTLGCLYAENIRMLGVWLQRTVKEKDMVLFLGAGDIYYVAQYLLRELR
ncbi:MAG: hypothetical protein IJX88_04050 [Clostridia bacterium]|nr:hypothetical protein [Clostridia bacterium]